MAGTLVQFSPGDTVATVIQTASAQDIALPCEHGPWGIEQVYASGDQGAGAFPDIAAYIATGWTSVRVFAVFYVGYVLPEIFIPPCGLGPTTISTPSGTASILANGAVALDVAAQPCTVAIADGVGRADLGSFAPGAMPVWGYSSTIDGAAWLAEFALAMSFTYAVPAPPPVVPDPPPPAPTEKPPMPVCEGVVPSTVVPGAAPQGAISEWQRILGGGGA